MRKFIFKFWHGFKNVYLEVVIQYLNLKPLVKGQPPEAEVLLYFEVANDVQNSGMVLIIFTSKL